MPDIEALFKRFASLVWLIVVGIIGRNTENNGHQLDKSGCIQ